MTNHHHTSQWTRQRRTGQVVQRPQRRLARRDRAAPSSICTNTLTTQLNRISHRNMKPYSAPSDVVSSNSPDPTIVPARMMPGPILRSRGPQGDRADPECRREASHTGHTATLRSWRDGKQQGEAIERSTEPTTTPDAKRGWLTSVLRDLWRCNQKGTEPRNRSQKNCKLQIDDCKLRN